MTGDELRRLIEPTIEGLGYELSDLEVKIGGREGVIRIYIDQLPEGIGLDDCEAVSRQVSALLDVEDPFSSNYSLEVSSPGLDRRLIRIEHFQRFMGEEVRVKLRFPLDGRRNFRGEIKSASGKNIEVEVDGELHRLAIDSIDTARLVPTL